MLLLSEKFNNLPVMSLQTGAQVARTTTPILDPGILEVVAYNVSGPRLEGSNMVLLTRDIREVSDIGIIVDSSDELVMSDEIVKVKRLIELGFKLIDMQVIDERGTKLGRVYNYALDPVTFTIHKLYVKRPLLKSLQTSDLTINRTQITEINNKAIVVHSGGVSEQAQPVGGNGQFVNPFRGRSPRPQTNSSDTHE